MSHPVADLFGSRERIVAGLMSGTSMDGIDAAIVRISGSGRDVQIETLGFVTEAYSEDLCARLGAQVEAGTSDVRGLALLHAALAERWAEAVGAALDNAGLSPEALDVVGSHGQTVQHVPEPVSIDERPIRATLQIGDPARLAARLGVPVIADFRSADVARGGQGAPLAPYLDDCAFAHASETRGLLNLGGIANLTVLPAGEGPEAARAFDTGPANMLADALTQRLTGQPYDRDGQLAGGGTPDLALVRDLLEAPVFRQLPPKSTGREAFGADYADMLVARGPSDPADLVATALALTAHSIADAVERFVPQRLDRVLASGGGVHNRTLMELLAEALPCPVETTRGLGRRPRRERSHPVRASRARMGERRAYGPSRRHRRLWRRDAGRALPPLMLLDVHCLTKSFSDGVLPVVNGLSFGVEEGELLAILGPSGCGKTTALRVIAGFLPADRGRITLGGTPLADDGVHTPPEKREIGFVFQDHALFPHLSVQKNVEFGLRGWNRRQKQERAAEVLKLVGLSGLAARSPEALSGGQQQRVALARALAPRPRLLLLDEPFSGLDALLRHEMQGTLRATLRAEGTTAILVTHDQEEALQVADRVAVMQAGRIDQIGTPEAIYATPRTLFVAQFLGQTNLTLAEASGASAETPFGTLRLHREAEGTVLVALRPEHVSIARETAPESQANTPEASGSGVGVVVDRAYKGHDVTYRVQLDPFGIDCLVHSPEAGFAVGDRVRVRATAPAVVLDKAGA